MRLIPVRVALLPACNGHLSGAVLVRGTLMLIKLAIGG